MDDGTRDTRDTRHTDAYPGPGQARPVPRPAPPHQQAPAVPPYAPVPPPGGQPVPPRPAHAPGTPAPSAPSQPASPAPRSAVADWLDAPRPEAAPGIFRLGHRPPKSDGDGPERLPSVTVVGLLIPLVVALLLWSLWRRGAVPYQGVLLKLFTPDDWWWGGTLSPKGMEGSEARVVYDGVFFAVLVWAVGRLGSWPDVARHVIGRRPQPARALLAAVAALGALALVFPGAFGAGWDPVPVVAPLFSLVALISGGYGLFASPLFTDSLYALITLLVVWPFARLGGWLPYLKELAARRKAAADPAAAPPARLPRSQWPDLRDAGQHQAADVLTAEVAGGRMNDVDCARVHRAWDRARREGRLTGFTDTVLRDAGAAWTHPSGARDLPARQARHDLLQQQVRLGRWVPTERAPKAYHDAGAALGPDTLGTSLLVVGPPGSGKTRHVIQPVTEFLALQALTGTCAFVAVGTAGAPLGRPDAYDVVIRIGDPDSPHDLDPYAECDDADEAAAVLAEALAGDLDAVGTQRAVTALAQLLGPYRAVHGHFPPLPVLRELLEGDPGVLAALRAGLESGEHAVMRRELDARMRQTGTAADVGPVLAGRLALLDRPVFAGFLGTGDRADHRPFSLRAVAHHPLRVRIELPEHGHEEAARLLTRLVLAQFHTVVRDTRRPHFACLVLDDATGCVTPESVRRIQRLRAQNAGVVLALRTVADVPEALHGPLLGAVGCRMALSGVTTWDGSRFAHAWGTEWVETTEVAKHTVFADQPMTRAIHALRKLVTGKAVTTDAVTTKQVERERWSASQLAHEVPPGHAVLSLTSVHGEHAPPLLVDLRG
ncbi:ATP/GTP-binding protein [Streptomyces thermoviolaceus]|uniref:ATP/GTP-binding protein n=1 Tax=Streptomyces thermoviolaceus TaxID=1952 RepID=UPI00203C3183|nr:ATP/GTP-binding protein [Streptomyces thermoviolaceus]MCM3264534.1 ATP/GTP-binding protein [Streptomyces thermoviolaceus]